MFNLLVTLATPQTSATEMTKILMDLVNQLSRDHAATLRAEYADVTEGTASVLRVHELHYRAHGYLNAVMSAGLLAFDWEPWDTDNASFGLLFDDVETAQVPLPSISEEGCQCGACHRERAKNKNESA